MYESLCKGIVQCLFDIDIDAKQDEYPKSSSILELVVQQFMKIHKADSVKYQLRVPWEATSPIAHY